MSQLTKRNPDTNAVGAEKRTTLDWRRGSARDGRDQQMVIRYNSGSGKKRRKFGKEEKGG